MAAPTVSVLLPARDAEATVEAAARCILEGTFEDLELLAVDDGSTDGTRKVLERLAADDARVRLFDSGGKGVVAAMEVAVAHARAPHYLARMDADDLCGPDRLREHLAAMEADPSLWAVGSRVEIFSRGAPVSPNLALYAQWLSSLRSPELLYRDRLIESPLCNPSTLIRREAFERVGGWKEDDVPEDWALWLAMIEAGGRLCVAGHAVFRWADHERRLTRTDPRYSWAALQKLKARHLARTLKGPIQLWGAGEMGLALFRHLRAAGVETARFIDVHPRKIGQRIEGVEVVAPNALGGPDGRHLVAAVGAKGARAEIRFFLAARGWEEGRDFTCAG